MFVVNFNERVSLGLPATIRFTNSTDELEGAIRAAPAGGQTALYDAVAEGLEELRAANRDRKVLIVVSDGGDNASKHKLNDILTLVRQSNAILYTLGIFDNQDDDRNPAVLKRLAKETGGEAFLPKSLDDVTPICERIASDIRNQYTIAYIPTNRKRDGTYRAVQVKASTRAYGHIVVRTRTGYFAPSTIPPPDAKLKVADRETP
jgi:VWFA-related protein